MLLLKFDTLSALEQLSSQPNDTVSPKSSEYNINTQTAFVDDTFVAPQFFEMQYLHE